MRTVGCSNINPIMRKYYSSLVGYIISQELRLPTKKRQSRT
jgi:hypothetical protein